MNAMDTPVQDPQIPYVVTIACKRSSPPDTASRVLGHAQSRCSTSPVLPTSIKRRPEFGVVSRGEPILVRVTGCEDCARRTTPQSVARKRCLNPTKSDNAAEIGSTQRSRDKNHRQVQRHARTGQARQPLQAPVPGKEPRPPGDEFDPHAE